MFRILFLRMTAVLFTAIVFGVLAGCAKGERRSDATVPAASMADSANVTDSTSTAASQVTIRGALSYRERMALPPDARAIVELHRGAIDVDVPLEGGIVFHVRLPSGEGPVSVRPSVRVPRL